MKKLKLCNVHRLELSNEGDARKPIHIPFGTWSYDERVSQTLDREHAEKIAADLAGKIKFTFEPEKEAAFSFKVRVPRWHIPVDWRKWGDPTLIHQDFKYVDQTFGMSGTGRLTVCKCQHWTAREMSGETFAQSEKLAVC